MVSKIGRVAAVLGLAAALSGVIYGLKEHTKVFWKREQPAYLEQYQQAVGNREERLLQWLRADDREGVQRQRTLVEKIADANYRPLSANVQTIDSAALVILGDMHTYMDRQLNLLLPELVRRGDRVLLEQPTDRYQILDLSAYDAQRASPALPHGGERGSREGQLRTTLQNIDVAVRGVQSLENEMQLFDWASPERGNFLQFLVGKGTGMVIPIDAPSTLRDAYLCDIIQYSVLKSAVFHLDKGASPLHPFERWMIEEDLGIADEGVTADTLKRDITTYMKNMPDTDFDHERQEQIISNVLQQVNDLHAGERAVLTIGSAHLNHIAPTLIDALQEARVPYVAFTPDTENVFRTATAAEMANWDYVETLLGSYITIRGATSGQPYRGTVEGMADRFAEAFAKQ